MKLLITGGLGHIGSKIIRTFSQEIYLVDNLLTQRYCSLFGLPKNVTFFEMDFDDISEGLLNQVDVIIHLAAITDAAGSFGKTKEIEEVNIVKTKKLIDKCVKLNKLFIFPSSTSVYGVSADTVYEDNDKYLNPQSPYATSKLMIENYITEKLQRYYILRCGTICGISPGIRFHTAVNKFCYQAIFRQPLTIWQQNMNMVRPYLGIQDFCNAVWKLLDKEIYGIYNLVTQHMTINELIHKIESLLPDQYVPLFTIFINTPLLNQYSYYVSTAKLRSSGHFYALDNIDNHITDTLNLLRGA